MWWFRPLDFTVVSYIASRRRAAVLHSSSFPSSASSSSHLSSSSIKLSPPATHRGTDQSILAIFCLNSGVKLPPYSTSFAGDVFFGRFLGPLLTCALSEALRPRRSPRRSIYGGLLSGAGEVDSTDPCSDTCLLPFSFVLTRRGMVVYVCGVRHAAISPQSLDP